MNAPQPAPTNDPNGALFEELQQLGWAIGVHSDSLQNYCALHDAVGADYAIGCLTYCLRRALVLRAHIKPIVGDQS
jgi:hypothetical protein